MDPCQYNMWLSSQAIHIILDPLSVGREFGLVNAELSRKINYPGWSALESTSRGLKPARA